MRKITFVSPCHSLGVDPLLPLAGAPQLSRIPYDFRSYADIENATGYVRVYGREGNNWTQIGQEIVGKQYAEMCGKSVSISADGTVVAVASLVAGRVRVYWLEEKWEDSK